MDATEKVARTVAEIDRQSWDALNASAQCDYQALAAGLLAAFPQLALEGHEEWATRIDDRRRLLAPDRPTADDATRSIRNATTQRRTVYTSPWQEVQP